ncbi:PaaI family thioesterase [Caldalkalibacillus salinus]|uniref:PaaI family thioesterase n=1 Tax=Caldalkalibacillus salinus TaxID=2803787 RepID=UPI001921EC0F|nr:PaaI family thioesterase [Caldalkalibacillus salinus]
MKTIYSVKDLLGVVSGEVAPPACDQTLGVEIDEASEGYAKGTWHLDDQMLNGHQVAMGGFVSAAADIVMAYAIASVLTDKQAFSSINLNTTFHRPTRPGQVHITAKVERAGRTTAYLTAELTQQGKRVASTTSSLMVFNEID